jgi:hypothetical protein
MVAAAVLWLSSSTYSCESSFFAVNFIETERVKQSSWWDQRSFQGAKRNEVYGREFDTKTPVIKDASPEISPRVRT